MVPLKTGLCFAQIIVLMLLLMGAHAASVVWYQSLGNIKYGTAPTVPASGMSMIQQAIANDIVMATYQASNGTPSGNVQTLMGTQSFFSPESAAIQQQANKAFPDLCKLAFALVAKDGTILPDNKITGANGALYQSCLTFTQDFMKSGKAFYQDENELGAFSTATGVSPPMAVVGQLVDFSSCLYSGKITSDCLTQYGPVAPNLNFAGHNDVWTLTNIPSMPNLDAWAKAEGGLLLRLQG